MMENSLILILFGMIYGVLTIWISWFLSDIFFIIFDRYLNRKKINSNIIYFFLQISWAIFFSVFWILMVLLSTFFPIQEDLRYYFSSPYLWSMFITMLIFGWYDKRQKH
ncbi:hypothetical protein [Acinetobacter populi]|uniref:Uncharacterized protein n=1 Tax=Acinetobacter populi TaxID=1582270 RepID=A0A1Z9Z1G2_9GAMM|nr:hypothetical protein [Acinetobacter populi]OUY08285.1 hypothetical protein CAP51_01295 [Acinetobacter populi]